jgi:nucleotide-binding universal stress UspA family protein
MNTLLVLTDFSAAADHALRYAGVLAISLQARLLLLHVQPSGLLNPDAFTGKHPDRNKNEIQALLDARCNQLQTNGTPCTSQVAKGNVAEEVADAVRQHNALLAIAGKANTEETPDELVDSTTLDLLRDMPCPVLIVPEAYSQTQLPARVLLATDHEAVTFGASAAAANGLLRHWQPAVVLTHVSTDNDNVTATEASFLMPLLREVNNVQQQRRTHDDAEEGIIEAIQAAQADWAILISRHRSRLSLMFNNSVTARVVLHSPVPVLVVGEES